ncbi:hypothetical protein [Chryseobacterium oranimense]|uniref:hypothetical protein n=1 Tax=Chryseobacterium oranimense TaxID=421058 RepID=UPI0031DB964B
MKKLLFATIFTSALLLPVQFTATVNNIASKTELSSKKQKKKGEDKKEQKQG